MQQFRIVPALTDTSLKPKWASFTCTRCGNCLQARFRQYATATEAICTRCAASYMPAKIAAALSDSDAK